MNKTRNEVILEVNNLKMHFPIKRGVFRRKAGEVKAVDDIDFTVARSGTLGIVGESGCGKTTLVRCISRLYLPTSGSIWLNGTDISGMPEKELKPLRRSIGAVFQDSRISLNPRQRAGGVVADPLIVHHLADKAELDDRVAELLRLAGLDPAIFSRLPGELNEEQQQRLALARALATQPSLVIFDEPVAALDVPAQARIINLLGELQESLGLAYLFLSRDPAMVQYFSDRVAVMYLGRFVELATPAELNENPLHPYTRAVIAATPLPDPIAEKSRRRTALIGEAPSPLTPPPGCHFHPRCPLAIDECREQRPPLRDAGGGHLVACIRAQRIFPSP